MFADLNSRLLAVIEVLESGDVIDEASVNGLMADIQQAVPKLSTEHVRVLNRHVDQAIGLVVAQQERISTELRQMRKGKSALDGYNHIRGYRTSQRLCRKA